MEALILGLIQGLTEFLPISSSGHLLLIPYLLDWQPGGLTYDVALNTGTFGAVVVYFWPRWRSLVVGGILGRQKKEGRLLGLLAVATLPAAFAGYFGENAVVSYLRQPIVAASMLILFGLILGLAERAARLNRRIDELGWRGALAIGASQALALIPGVSRSGITMTSGLLLGLTKEAAAEFSFLLLAPISLGAAASQAASFLNAPNLTTMVQGTVVSFLVGLLAIHFLLRFLKQYGYRPYVIYRVAVGLLFLFLIAGR